MQRMSKMGRREGESVDSPDVKIQTLIGDKFPKIVTPLISNAKHSLDILVFDWRWYPMDASSPVQIFNQNIIRAIRRGVKVRVLANHLDIVDLLNHNGAFARKVTSSNLIHAKLMIIDNEITILGSHNYTASAFSKNYECSVAISSPEICNEFGSYFDVLFEHYGYH